MATVPFSKLMDAAERGGYAVGYFESWNLESLLAVADAAEAARSPVILGFSGVSLARRDRLAPERLGDYARLGMEVCGRISVPACLLFNECPDFDWVVEATRIGFGMVMFSDDTIAAAEQLEQTRRVVGIAHDSSVSVEGELDPLLGMRGDLVSAPSTVRLTDPVRAAEFVKRTSVDALAVSVGQAHLHGRTERRLDMERITELKAAVPVPLVLHGATSISRSDIMEAVRRGIRKVNVGSVLKQAYFDALRSACAEVAPRYNPYDVLGSGLKTDVFLAGRQAMRGVVEDLMRLLGSAGKAR
jgi:ketose-bisphosphate aldolase